MSSPSDAAKDREIQRDILQGRKFSLSELIGREGGNFLKGESPVPKLVQATTQINTFIAKHLKDPSGALQYIMQGWVDADQQVVSEYLDQPLVALSQIVKKILENEELFYELVRQVDFQSSKLTGDRPYFQKPGEAPHPDDEYTHESVKHQLLDLLNEIPRLNS